MIPASASNGGYCHGTVEPPAPLEDDEDREDGGARMGFLEHLDELRMRLIRSCAAIAAGMAVSLVFVNRLADVVLASMQSSVPAGSSLIYSRPGEGFAFYFDLALMGGLVIAAPFVTYQIWRFIAPGLHAERKAADRSVPCFWRSVARLPAPSSVTTCSFPA